MPTTGEAFAGASEGVRVVSAFVEKPDAARAEQYLRDGEHLWNAGIFVFRADVMANVMTPSPSQLSAGLNVEPTQEEGAHIVVAG